MDPNDQLHELEAIKDQILGTVATLLDSRDKSELADFLDEADLRFEVSYWGEDAFDQAYFTLTPCLSVDPNYLDLCHPEVSKALTEVLDGVGTRFETLNFENVSIGPLLESPEWRQRREDLRDREDPSEIHIPRIKRIRRDQMVFHSEEEVLVYEELKKQQAELSKSSEGGATIGISGNAGVWVGQRLFVPDLLVFLDGKVAVIEVDGPHHKNRAAADRSKDRLLEDAGISFVERITVEDAVVEESRRDLVRRVIRKLQN